MVHYDGPNPYESINTYYCGTFIEDDYNYSVTKDKTKVTCKLCSDKLKLEKELLKQINNPKYKCSNCGKKMIKPVVITGGVPNEGCSMITNMINGNVVYIGGEDFCSIDCLIDNIQKGLS
jgi:hypothetical protein